MNQELSQDWYKEPALKLMWEIKKWYNANGGFDDKGNVRSFPALEDGRVVRLAACDRMPIFDMYSIEVTDNEVIKDMSLVYGHTGKSKGKINVMVFQKDIAKDERRCCELSDLTSGNTFVNKMRIDAMAERNEGGYIEGHIRDQWANIAEKCYREARPLTPNTLKYFSDVFHEATRQRYAKAPLTN